MGRASNSSGELGVRDFFSIKRSCSPSYIRHLICEANKNTCKWYRTSYLFLRVLPMSSSVKEGESVLSNSSEKAYELHHLLAIIEHESRLFRKRAPKLGCLLWDSSNWIIHPLIIRWDIRLDQRSFIFLRLRRQWILILRRKRRLLCQIRSKLAIYSVNFVGSRLWWLFSISSEKKIIIEL